MASPMSPLSLSLPDMKAIWPLSFPPIMSSQSMQELFRAKSLRATVDVQAQSLALTVATREEIDSELKAEHSAVNVLHVGGGQHHGTARIIRSFGPAAEPVKESAPASATLADPVRTESISVPPAFEHLEAVERLCLVIVDLFIKHVQLVSAYKEVLKKIKPTDSTLDARMTALERWKAELMRRARGVHVQQTGATSLLAGGADAAHASEEAVLRRFDTFLHWLSKLIKALEHKGIKFHGKPVWLPH